MNWKDIDKAPAIAKKNHRWLRLRGDNDGIYFAIGYWDGVGWYEVGTQGQALVGVTHWAPFS